MQWQRFQRQVAQNKRPHAMLLSGQRGIGKWDFAQWLARAILCHSPVDGKPCGHCRECRLNEANTHPDLLAVIPEQQGRHIKIDQVRQLTDFVGKTSRRGHAKVVLLAPVEALNSHAANALLKSLEEPAGDMLLLLVAHVLSAVMPTIRSRCQLMPMPAPNRQQSLAWLQTLQLDDHDDGSIEQLLTLAAGAPLTARAMTASDCAGRLNAFIECLQGVNAAQSPIDVAKQWLNTGQDTALTDVLEWWLQVVSLLIKQHFIHSAQSEETPDTDRLNQLYWHCRHYPLGRLFRFSDKLLALKYQFFTGANFNKQLLLEELLLEWQTLAQSSPAKIL